MIPSAVRTGHPTCIRRGNRYFTRLSANFYNLILRQAYNSFESDQNSSPKNVLSGQRLGLPPLMIYSRPPAISFGNIPDTMFGPFDARAPRRPLRAAGLYCRTQTELQ
jgi:hypothetical protein